MRSIKLYLSMAFLLFTACSSSGEFPEERVWIGKNKHELFKKWGLPHKTESDGKGGQKLTYDLSKSKPQPKNPTDKEYQHIRTFFVDSTGVIYNHTRDEGTAP